jgi:hypothetical protein
METLTRSASMVTKSSKVILVLIFTLASEMRK